MIISSVISDIVQIVNRRHSDLQNLDADDHPQYLDVNGTRPVKHIDQGLDADKPANPVVGQIYLATDTKIMYECLSDGIWTPDIVIETYGPVASGSVRNSNDDQHQTQSGEYVKLKEIKLNGDLKACRVKWDIGAYASSQHTYAKIYKNGIPIGEEKVRNGGGASTYYQDFNDFKSGDLIQIYVRVDETSSLGYVKNMKLCYDWYDRITKIKDWILPSPYRTSDFYVISTTNQDPE